MTESEQRPAQASVIYVRIPGFARKPVVEQAVLKDALHGLIADAVAPLALRDRIVLDAAEGAAIVVPGFPGIALGTARRVQAAAVDTPFCIGVDHGPLQVREEAHGVVALVGDGLAAAVTVAEFAEPGTLLTSRSFREALKTAAPESAAELRKAGDFTDSRVRTHELFALDPKADARRRRRWYAAALAGVALILGAGVAGRMVRQEIEASHRPGILVLDVKPSGQIFVDGEDQGTSPPLTELRVKAGSHLIEVHNGDLPPLRLQANLAPGQRTAVSHTFVIPPPPPPPQEVKPKPKPKPAQKAKPPQPKPTFWEELMRKLGFR
jgi:hypothetical protein